MSVFIGRIKCPHHNSPTFGEGDQVWASSAGVELRIDGRGFTQDPVAARNFAALLVRAADEVERMRSKPPVEHADEVNEIVEWLRDLGGAKDGQLGEAERKIATAIALGEYRRRT